MKSANPKPVPSVYRSGLTTAGTCGLHIDPAIYRRVLQEAVGHEDDTLRQEVLDLADMVTWFETPGTCLYEFFSSLFKRQDEDCLSLNDVAKAKAAFYSLPEAQQRRYLSGWKPVMGRMTAADFAEAGGMHGGGNAMKRYLVLTTGANDEIDAAQQSRMSFGESNTVRVQIQEGAEKRDVVNALATMLRMAVGRWPELIAMEPDSFDHLKEPIRTYKDAGEAAELKRQVDELIQVVEGARKGQRATESPSRSQAARPGHAVKKSGKHVASGSPMIPQQ